MNTKGKILEAAISLFNEQGVRRVSTNHIAKSLNMSPGNLYYHYKNKEEIIRAILEEMILDISDVFKHEPDDIPTVHSVKNAMEQTFRLEYKYRFFYRELIGLSRNDPGIREKYKEIRNQKLDEISSFVKKYSDAGYLEAEDPAVYSRMIKTAWMIYNYWLAEADLENIPVTREYIKEGIIHIFDLFEPFMSEEGGTYYRKLKALWKDER